MYAHTAIIKVKTEFRDIFLKAMEINARGAICNEPRCLRFDVYRDSENLNIFHLHEVYLDREALEYHHSQDHCIQCVSYFNEWLVEPPTLQETLPLFPPANIWQAVKETIIQHYEEDAINR